MITQLAKYDNEYFLGSICNEDVGITLIPVYVGNNDYFMILSESTFLRNILHISKWENILPRMVCVREC